MNISFGIEYLFLMFDCIKAVSPWLPDEEVGELFELRHEVIYNAPLVKIALEKQIVSRNYRKIFEKVLAFWKKIC